MISELKSRLRMNLSVMKPGRLSIPGLYHFIRLINGEKIRLHLRLENDGNGLLLINANRSLHLNPSAALMAYLYLSNETNRQVTKTITDRFQVPIAQARHDYAQFIDDFEQLINPDGPCPVCELDLDTLAPFSKLPSAPYRMDLAITYLCNNDCAHCYNARPRSGPELSTAQWKTILDHLWKIGIPHLVFTGGEPTLRPDLPELVAHAERNGQITGINTNGRRLKDKSFLQRLVDAGLDHVQVTLESHEPLVHDRMTAMPGAWQETVDGIRNVLSTRLYVMTNTTLLNDNAPGLSHILSFLESLKVPTIGLNALIYSGRGASVGSGLAEDKLPGLLKLARSHCDRTGQRLIWYTPTRYCHFDPMMLELGIKGCTAALYNMCIEPDGSVLPCQSYYVSLGNILKEDWQQIWNHDLAVSLRERREAPASCRTCSLFTECGGGCPLARPYLSGGFNEHCLQPD